MVIRVDQTKAREFDHILQGGSDEGPSRGRARVEETEPHMCDSNDGSGIQQRGLEGVDPVSKGSRGLIE